MKIACPHSRWLRRQVLKLSSTTRTPCRRSRWLRWHSISVINDFANTDGGVFNNYADWGHGQDYADTFGKLRRLFTDFKETISWKKVLGCVYKPNSNNLKTWKSRVLIVVDYADTRFSNFAIEYLRKNKTKSLQNCFCLFNVHIGPKSNLFRQKNGRQSSDTVPLRWRYVVNILRLGFML